MKRIPLLIALVLVFSFGLAYGHSFDVDHIDGTWIDVAGDYGTPNAEYVAPGADVTYHLRLTNTDAVNTIKGLTNGFALTGNSVLPVCTPQVVTEDYFDLVNSIVIVDGATIDTVCLGYSVMMLPGLPALYDEITHTITTQAANDGDVLCIDSSYYPPSGLWLWALSDASAVEPDWMGPYCFTTHIIPNLPPTIDVCPTALTASHCDLATYDFDATDTEGDPYTFAVLDGVGTINATSGVWVYQPTLADVGASLYVEVNASDAQPGPSCVYDLMFTNLPPVFTGGCGATHFSGADMYVAFGVTAVTGDCDPVTVTLLDVAPIPDGAYDVNGYTATINDTGTTFIFTFEATDGVDPVTCEVDVEVKGETNFEIMIEKDHGTDYYPYGVIQGQHAFVDVTMNAGSEIPAGFDLLIAYDASALVFQAATPGADFYAGGCGWEYFDYRFGATGNCGNACPSGMLRVVGIAETNNGPNHPSCLKPTLPATMFTLDFLVTNDRTFECMFIPIRFFWFDCGDNSLAYFPLTAQDSVVQGIEASVWNYYGGYDPNEYLEVTSGAVFPGYFGAQELCDNVDPLKPDPKPIIDFYNGGIDIICSEDIDGRGDVNLNGELNEIADAVLFSNYFIMGLDVFKVNIDGQIAATDVNADGLTLSVADLVYLIRVIVGDAIPYPKLGTVVANYTIDGGIVTVDGEMGGAFLTVAGNVTPELLADNMELKYGYDGKMTRILVSSMQGNTFNGEFLNVNGEVLSIELASAAGSIVAGTQMPTNFELAQNYPNPFNPTTTIGYSMKTAGDYSLTIYNVTGQKVAEFAGSSVAGNHSIEWDATNEASGIYFYKFSTDNFSDTKKMVLLK